jgi:ketosteroid isomerase-like protein
MDAIAAMLAERACERLVLEYAARLDAGRTGRLWELFTADGVWEMPGWRTFRGHDELRADATGALWSDDRVTMHFCTNVVVHIDSGDRARGRSHFLNLRRDFSSPEAVVHPAASDVPRYAGHYVDRFRRTDEGWRIEHRLVSVEFRASA